MDLNNKRKRYVKIDQNTESEKFLHCQMEWKMTWKMTLMNQGSNLKRRILNILIPEANIHVIDDRVENPEDSVEESQEDRVDVLEAKEKPEGQSKEKEKRKGKEKAKGKEEAKKVEVTLNWWKKASPHPKNNIIFLPRWLILFLIITHLLMYFLLLRISIHC